MGSRWSRFVGSECCHNEKDPTARAICTTSSSRQISSEKCVCQCQRVAGVAETVVVSAATVNLNLPLLCLASVVLGSHVSTLPPCVMSIFCQEARLLAAALVGCTTTLRQCHVLPQECPSRLSIEPVGHVRGAAP